MQIHEITLKNKRVNEGFMDAMRGIGSVAATGVNTALGTNIGGAMSGARNQPGSVGAQTSAQQAMSTLAPKIAKEQNDLWTQNVQGMMANQGVSSPKQLDQAVLKAALDDQVNRLLKRSNIDNWKQFASTIDPKTQGGQGQNYARQVVAALGNAFGNIVKNTMSGAPNYATQNMRFWEQIAPTLVTMQNMSQFQGSSKQAMAPNVGTTSQAAQIFSKAGVTGGALTGMQSIFNSLGPIPTGTLSNTQRNILQAAGLQVK